MDSMLLYSDIETFHRFSVSQFPSGPDCGTVRHELNNHVLLNTTRDRHLDPPTLLYRSGAEMERMARVSAFPDDLAHRRAGLGYSFAGLFGDEPSHESFSAFSYGGGVTLKEHALPPYFRMEREERSSESIRAEGSTICPTFGNLAYLVKRGETVECYYCGVSMTSVAEASFGPIVQQTSTSYDTVRTLHAVQRNAFLCASCGW